MNASPESKNEAVIHRFYEELWNCWRVDVADEIVSEAVLFRGSLGRVCEGRDEFKCYVEDVRAAFPDWHNRIDEVISDGDRVVTRMTWTGTHRGLLGDLKPTGARVEYGGASFFRLDGDLIEEAWVVGDTQELWRALGVLPARIGK
ncbi:MAG TPA: ester cyclase [Solirubrobacterales bacterium]|nr:ester cyclase [Solirubrobacterales bacterium]